MFCLLAGTGAFLSRSRGRTRSHLARYLLSRGLWLVLLELTIIQFSWHFAWDAQAIRCQVLWALGWSMVLLSAAIFLPPWAVLTGGVVLFSVNDALSAMLASQATLAPWVRVLLASGGPLRLTPAVQLLVKYPVLPWFGVMAAGYGLGQVWQLARRQRKRLLTTLGTVMILLFFLLRFFSNRPELHAWATQSSGLFTLLSFFNCRKYPP